MRFLIAGYGFAARRHLRNLRSLEENDVLFYDPTPGARPSRDLAPYPLETNLTKALDHHPDAVIIANPAAQHMDVAIPAAEAGRDLLIETPVAEDLRRAEDLRAALREGGGQAMTAYPFRFHPGLQRVQQLVTRGTVGEIASVRAHWGEYLPAAQRSGDYRSAVRPEPGAGVVLTLSHPFDYLRWLLGDVEDLWAYTANSSILNVPVETIAEVGLRFSRGALGTLHLDFLQQPPRHHLEMIGTLGTLSWDNNTGAARLYNSAIGTWQSYLPPQGFRQNDVYKEEMRAFIRVVRREIEPPCTLEDGLAALRLALSVKRAAEAGEILSLNDDHHF